jgi:hypothetical protein
LDTTSTGNVIFGCGDFNFCSYRNFDGSPPSENASLKRIFPEFMDVWEYVHPELQPTYTFNGKVNRLVGNEEECMRYDRICAYFHNQSYEATAIDLLDAPIMIPPSTTNNNTNQWLPMVVASYKGEFQVYPSDHFGLFAVFQVRNTIAISDSNNNNAAMEVDQQTINNTEGVTAIDATTTATTTTDTSSSSSSANPK